ncbi:MAG TPA: ATP-dependent 6-phosphofructokinase [Alphaproteobacteria bacterium]|jgi:6-phosphofructokinase 1
MTRIGILTSGGDCAGLNAVIRAAVVHAVHTYGWEVVGLRQGTLGLLKRPVDTMHLDVGMFAGSILRESGTMLGTTNTGDPFAFPMPDGSKKDRSEEVIEGYRMLGLSGLIVIGGDGSFRIMNRLARQGNIPLVGVPKTIDNDLERTENSVGFITAVNVATEALDRLQPTAASHNRVMILEVMGRDAGHIALASGIAGGADIILLPEIPWRLDTLVAKIKRVREDERRNFALVVVAEGVKTPDGRAVTQQDGEGKVRYGGIGHYLGERLSEAAKAETRVTVLGHVQRGGSPATTDRVLGSAFGVAAVDLLAAGKYGRMVTWQNRHVVDVPIEDTISGHGGVNVDGDLVRTARGLGICLGDA